MALSQRSPLGRLIHWRYLPHSFYTVLGLAVFITIITLINTYVLHIKVETAVVSVPIETITVPVEGYIDDIYVTPGKAVKKGDPLLKVSNVRLEKEYALARLDANEADLAVAYYQNLLTNETTRLSVYKAIGTNRLAAANANLETAKVEVHAAEKSFARMKTLHDKHYLSAQNWDREKEAFKSTQQRYKSAMALAALEQRSLASVDEGLFFTGNRLEGNTADIRTEIANAEKHRALKQEKVKIYENLASRLILKAPYDGTVLNVLRTTGNTADATKPVLLLEQANASKQINAYLTQEEVNHVGARERVKIYLPTLGLLFHGKVIAVNRTSGFVDEVRAQYQSRNLYTDRSAMVTIDIAGREQQAFNKVAVAGTPAVVYLPRTFDLL